MVTWKISYYVYSPLFCHYLFLKTILYSIVVLSQIGIDLKIQVDFFTILIIYSFKTGLEWVVDIKSSKFVCSKTVLSSDDLDTDAVTQEVNKVDMRWAVLFTFLTFWSLYFYPAWNFTSHEITILPKRKKPFARKRLELEIIIFTFAVQPSQVSHHI